MVGVHQEGRATAGDPVQIGRSRSATWEVGLVPAAADDPRDVRVLYDVLLDRLLVRRKAVRRREVAAPALEAALHRMDVRVHEAGQQETAMQIDDLGRGDRVP